MTETARLQKDHSYLTGNQKRDATLWPMFNASGSREDEYLKDDNGSLWYAPRGKRGKILTFAIPRTLIPGGVVPGSYHLRTPRRGSHNTVGERYSWPSLRKDVRQYVLSCGCRPRKRANRHKVWMIPARFMHQWEVIERMFKACTKCRRLATSICWWWLTEPASSSSGNPSPPRDH